MAEVEVGDVFVMTGGYNQINIDYYQVVELTPSGKSARLQTIAQVTIEEDEGWELVSPDIDNFTGAPFTKRIGDAGDEPCFRIWSKGYAYHFGSRREIETSPTNGTPRYQTGPYAGH